MSIKSLLNEEIENELTSLKKMKLGGDEYRVTVDGITRLVDRKIEIEKSEADAEKFRREKEMEYELTLKRLHDEKQSRFIGYIVTSAGIILPIVLTVWGTKASFEFEKEGTITTLMGRGFINKLISRK